MAALLAVISVGLPAPAQEPVDASTLDGKIVCGYQGWFMTPNDGNPPEVGFRHWGRGTKELGPGRYTIDMWPDVSEYPAEDLCETPAVILTNGETGKVFSSARYSTVDVHFRWMKEYGIDGVFAQRFISEAADPVFFGVRNRVLENVRKAANAHGRVFALEYDTSGHNPDTLHDALVKDWKYLVDEMKITQDPRYLRHNGKPVVEIWGLGFKDRGHDPAEAKRILDFFQNDPVYGGNTVVGGMPTWWREQRPHSDVDTDPAWAAVFRQFDVLNPWMVGRWRDIKGFENYCKRPFEGDLAEAKALGKDYLPVVWPGFSWDNLQELPEGKSRTSRDGGRFFWRQMHWWQSQGARMIFVAMFDEVDEGTAIFKVSGVHPETDSWVTYEGHPSDWYLQLTGAAARMLRGEIPLTDTIPIEPATPAR